MYMHLFEQSTVDVHANNISIAVLAAKIFIPKCDKLNLDPQTNCNIPVQHG